MYTAIICVGFGGQGILTTGMLIADAGNRQEKRVTFYPSYGSEMRGGTANCNIKISDKEIASPVCRTTDIVFAMNEPGIDKFEHTIKPGGCLFVNSSIVSESRKYRSKIVVWKVPALDLADKAGNTKASNILMLGTLIKRTTLFDRDFFVDSMCKYFDDSGKGAYNPGNIKMFNVGYDFT